MIDKRKSPISLQRIKKFTESNILINIDSIDENGKPYRTIIGNYHTVILASYGNQVVISAKILPDVSYIVKIDDDNVLIIQRDDEVLGIIRSVEDLESVIGAKDGRFIDLVFTKMLLEETEDEFRKPYGEIHENVREI